MRTLLCSFLLLSVLFVGCAEPATSPVTESPSTPAAKQSETKPADKETASTSALEPSVQLSDDELADGWISLFDGQTLFGWKAHSKADWEVQDGAIMVTSGEPGLLCTTTEFADYVLKLEFRAPPDTNSGVFLRTAPVVGKEDVTTKCYELNIAPPDNPFPTGSFVGRKKAEGEIGRGGEGEKDVSRDAQRSADWQSFEVSLEGGHAVVKHNDKVVLDYTDEKPIGKGFIGLQLNSGKVEFRNLKLKPLGLKQLYNGQDLSGWKPEGESKFTVADDGLLQVTSGKGYLESEESFADFIAQLEVRTNAKNLNSGLFFRCIPGEAMNGYESQIHNGFKEGDRSKPQDCGTGGIFRRVDARRVVANDQEWFTKTIIAQGSHIAVWVNGYQVTDWTDTREQHKNPRNGLRTEAGTLQVQGHDPTTDISLRNIRAVELPR